MNFEREYARRMHAQGKARTAQQPASVTVVVDPNIAIYDTTLTTSVCRTDAVNRTVIRHIGRDNRSVEEVRSWAIPRRANH